MAAGSTDKTNQNSQLPLVTVGIISYNRLHYLRATIESAKRCIRYPHTQWIVADASVEPGLQDYLKRLAWIDDVVLLDPNTDHVSAMNEVVARAKGDALLLWPDDVQFIVEGDWMTDCVEILMAHLWIGSMGLNCQRRITIQRHWSWRRWLNWKRCAGELKRYGLSFRRQQVVHSSRGFPVRTYGWTESGIVGSGIPSLTRTEVWRKLGPWKAPGACQDLVDSSGGGEDEMLLRFKHSGRALQKALPVLSVAADIVTDPTGTKAKVRGNKRYGIYMPPPTGTFYYRIYRQDELGDLACRALPVPFEEIVQPLGYDLPFDADGNLLKSSINTSVSHPLT